MAPVMTEKDGACFAAAFERSMARTADEQPAWLGTIRQAAMQQFETLGFPTTRDEAWRYTDVKPIAQTNFATVDGDADAADVPAAWIDQRVFDDNACLRVVFVNGRYSEALSRIDNMPKGVTAGSLRSALRDQSSLVEGALTKYASHEPHPFAALNTALIEDGAFIAIAKGAVVETPIHVVFVTTASAEPRAIHPRNLIIAGEHSQSTIIESYLGPDDCTTLTNVVTELVAEDASIVDHYKIEEESTAAYHIAFLKIHQGRDCNVTSSAFSIGGDIVRNEFDATLDGEGGHCTMNGLYVLNGTQHVDNFLRVEHAKPHCNSWEYFKGVLDDRSSGAFRGRIIVQEGAQKTDAKQTNKNLLLSPEAHVDTKPQLEIFADDVKCTHGATIGQIDEDALFYLRARGVPADAARALLVYAFANESLNEVKVDALRSHLERRLFERTPHGELSAV